MTEQETVHARFVSFLVTLGGMLVFALVIGIVAESISEKVPACVFGVPGEAGAHFWTGILCAVFLK